MQQLAEFALECVKRWLGQLVKLGNPIAIYLDLAVVQGGRVPRWQPENSLVNGAWRGNDVEVQIVKNRLRVNLGAGVSQVIGPVGKAQLAVVHAVAQ